MYPNLSQVRIQRFYESLRKCILSWNTRLEEQHTLKESFDLPINHPDEAFFMSQIMETSVSFWISLIRARMKHPLFTNCSSLFSPFFTDESYTAHQIWFELAFDIERLLNDPKITWFSICFPDLNDYDPITFRPIFHVLPSYVYVVKKIVDIENIISSEDDTHLLKDDVFLGTVYKNSHNIFSKVYSPNPCYLFEEKTGFLYQLIPHKNEKLSHHGQISKKMIFINSFRRPELKHFIAKNLRHFPSKSRQYFSKHILFDNIEAQYFVIDSGKLERKIRQLGGYPNFDLRGYVKHYRESMIYPLSSLLYSRKKLIECFIKDQSSAGEIISTHLETFHYQHPFHHYLMYQRKDDYKIHALTLVDLHRMVWKKGVIFYYHEDQFFYHPQFYLSEIIIPKWKERGRIPKIILPKLIEILTLFFRHLKNNFSLLVEDKTVITKQSDKNGIVLSDRMREIHLENQLPLVTQSSSNHGLGVLLDKKIDKNFDEEFCELFIEEYNDEPHEAFDEAFGEFFILEDLIWGSDELIEDNGAEFNVVRAGFTPVTHLDQNEKFCQVKKDLEEEDENDVDVEVSDFGDEYIAKPLLFVKPQRRTNHDIDRIFSNSFDDSEEDDFFYRKDAGHTPYPTDDNEPLEDVFDDAPCIVNYWAEKFASDEQSFNEHDIVKTSLESDVSSGKFDFKFKNDSIPLDKRVGLSRELFRVALNEWSSEEGFDQQHLFHWSVSDLEDRLYLYAQTVFTPDTHGHKAPQYSLLQYLLECFYLSHQKTQASIFQIVRQVLLYSPHLISKDNYFHFIYAQLKIGPFFNAEEFVRYLLILRKKAKGDLYFKIGHLIYMLTVEYGNNLRNVTSIQEKHHKILMEIYRMHHEDILSHPEKDYVRDLDEDDLVWWYLIEVLAGAGWIAEPIKVLCPTILTQIDPLTHMPLLDYDPRRLIFVDKRTQLLSLESTTSYFRKPLDFYYKAKTSQQPFTTDELYAIDCAEQRYHGFVGSVYSLSGGRPVPVALSVYLDHFLHQQVYAHLFDLQSLFYCHEDYQMIQVKKIHRFCESYNQYGMSWLESIPTSKNAIVFVEWTETGIYCAVKDNRNAVLNPFFMPFADLIVHYQLKTSITEDQLMNYRYFVFRWLEKKQIIWKRPFYSLEPHNTFYQRILTQYISLLKPYDQKAIKENTIIVHGLKRTFQRLLDDGPDDRLLQGIFLLKYLIQMNPSWTFENLESVYSKNGLILKQNVKDHILLLLNTIKNDPIKTPYRKITVELESMFISLITMNFFDQDLDENNRYYERNKKISRQFFLYGTTNMLPNSLCHLDDEVLLNLLLDARQKKIARNVEKKPTGVLDSDSESEVELERHIRAQFNAEKHQESATNPTPKLNVESTMDDLIGVIYFILFEDDETMKSVIYQRLLTCFYHKTNIFGQGFFSFQPSFFEQRVSRWCSIAYKGLMERQINVHTKEWFFSIYSRIDSCCLVSQNNAQKKKFEIFKDILLNTPENESNYLEVNIHYIRYLKSLSTSEFVLFWKNLNHAYLKAVLLDYVMSRRDLEENVDTVKDLKVIFYDYLTEHMMQCSDWDTLADDLIDMVVIYGSPSRREPSLSPAHGDTPLNFF